MENQMLVIGGLSGIIYHHSIDISIQSGKVFPRFLPSDVSSITCLDVSDESAAYALTNQLLASIPHLRVRLGQLHLTVSASFWLPRLPYLRKLCILGESEVRFSITGLSRNLQQSRRWLQYES